MAKLGRYPYGDLQAQLKSIDENQAKIDALNKQMKANDDANLRAIGVTPTTQQPLPAVTPAFKKWMNFNLSEADARNVLIGQMKRDPSFGESATVQDFHSYMAMYKKDPIAAVNGLQSLQNDLSVQMGTSPTAAKGVLAALITAYYPSVLKGGTTSSAEVVRSVRADKSSLQQFTPGISGAEARARKVAREMAAWGNG